VRKLLRSYVQIAWSRDTRVERYERARSWPRTFTAPPPLGVTSVCVCVCVCVWRRYVYEASSPVTDRKFAPERRKAGGNDGGVDTDDRPSSRTIRVVRSISMARVIDNVSVYVKQFVNEKTYEPVSVDIRLDDVNTTVVTATKATGDFRAYGQQFRAVFSWRFWLYLIKRRGYRNWLRTSRLFHMLGARLTRRDTASVCENASTRWCRRFRNDNFSSSPLPEMIAYVTIST